MSNVDHRADDGGRHGQHQDDEQPERRAARPQQHDRPDRRHHRHDADRDEAAVVRVAGHERAQRDAVHQAGQGERQHQCPRRAGGEPLAHRQERVAPHHAERHAREQGHEPQPEPQPGARFRPRLAHRVAGRGERVREGYARRTPERRVAEQQQRQQPRDAALTAAADRNEGVHPAAASPPAKPTADSTKPSWLTGPVALVSFALRSGGNHAGTSRITLMNTSASPTPSTTRAANADRQPRGEREHRLRPRHDQQTQHDQEPRPVPVDQHPDGHLQRRVDQQLDHRERPEGRGGDPEARERVGGGHTQRRTLQHRDDSGELPHRQHDPRRSPAQRRAWGGPRGAHRS